MMKIRIVGSGPPYHTRVYDVQTGVEIKNLTRIEIVQEAGGPPLVHITQVAEVVEMDVVAERRGT
jgi:hypothetical protein